MPTKDTLERKSLRELAVLCGKVADIPSADSIAVERAHALRMEWVQLQRPPRPALNQQQKIKAQQESLRKRMAEFLTGAL